MSQSTVLYLHNKKNIDIFPKMCNATSLSIISTGLEIGCYIVAILFEIIFSEYKEQIYIPITIARGLIIPFLILEVFGIKRQHFGIILSSCIFRALKFILAIVLVILLYIHADWFGK